MKRRDPKRKDPFLALLGVSLILWALFGLFYVGTLLVVLK